MRNYDRVNPTKPEGIENRKAYMLGGGIAGVPPLYPERWENR
ncbi:MAG: hypothetical protein ACI4B9_01485 [Eggerthellaceae bacterium]